MATLHKLPGRPAEAGMYRFTGDLTALGGPGRRVVRDLEITRVSGPGDALLALQRFGDLRTLALDGIAAMDLRPLSALPLSTLAISDARELNLAPLADMRQLERLLLSDLDDCDVPARLRLTPTLRYVALVSDAPGATPAVITSLIERIDWSALGELTMLDVRAGGAHAVAPVRVDLGFLRALPRLERLEMPAGVMHSGPGPSPLDPPFEGLSQRLDWLRIEGEHPEALTAQLQAYLPSTFPVVYPRPAYPDGTAGADRGDWQILEPDTEYPDAPWQTYGSLADAFGADGFEFEHEACDAARARLVRADPERASRVDLDSEANGTGIYAAKRDDLVWALDVLGLR